MPIRKAELGKKIENDIIKVLQYELSSVYKHFLDIKSNIYSAL